MAKKDEEKVYSIYRKGGPEAKRQAQMHENNIAALANKHVVQPMVQPLVEPFKSAGRAAMQTGVGQDFTRQADARAVRSHNKAMSTPEIEMQRVVGPPPVAPKAALGSAQANVLTGQVPEPPMMHGARPAPTPVVQQVFAQDYTVSDPAGGGTITVHPRKNYTAPTASTAQQGFATGRDYQTDSGLSVAFDSSVPQANRQAFMAPTGAGDPKAEAQWAKANQQWLARQPKQKVYRPQAHALTPPAGPEGGWGWKGRMEAYKSQLAAQSSANDIQSRERIARENNQAEAPYKQALAQQAFAQVAKEGQEIAIQQKENQMQEYLTNPKATKAQREQARSYYQALKAKTETPEKPRIFPGQAIDKFNPETKMIESSVTPPTVVEQDENGNYVTRYAPMVENQQAKPQPSQAYIDRMMANRGNKEYEDAYIKRFGALPY